MKDTDQGRLALLRDRPLSSLQCSNSECPSAVGEGVKGLSIRYWRGGGTIRYLHCHECGEEFSERRGTPMFGLRLSEERDVHEAASWIGVTVYNFCRVNRGLTVTDARGVRTHRTPAMAAGLSDHPLALTDISHCQFFQAPPRLKK